MSVVDLAKFSEEDFQPKAWINAACANRPTDDTLEKYLSELEIKLQLLAEDISISLEDHSRQALQRIPRALGEVGRVKEDGLKLQANTQSIVQKLVDAEETSARSVEMLASVDAVKVRAFARLAERVYFSLGFGFVHVGCFIVLLRRRSVDRENDNSNAIPLDTALSNMVSDT